ncbi:hypothetical protein ACFSL4_11335 [Streptomyces caeni]|uniref:Copper chaperone PCu(A)C n=1 Tax=Streptomyces caeni TaxID=2307231 RepID=A0ABW4IN94_9ACTN
MEKALGTALVTAGAALVASGGMASAAPDAMRQEETRSVEAAAQPVVQIRSLTPSFTLTGAPGQTVTRTGAVLLNVFTANRTGYTVSVQANAARLTPVTPGNPDSIPVGELSVRETGTTPFLPLSNTSAVLVHAQTTPSNPRGDDLSNDYRVTIPFVRPDTYRVVLTYIAATT